MSEPTETPADRARAAAGLEPAKSGKEVDRVANLSAELWLMQEQFQAAMPRGLEAAQLIRDAITAVRTVPDLIRCTKQTLLGALMTAAQLGLRPNVPALGHGWVLPFHNSRRGQHEAQWILGYQGMIELAQRSQLVAEIKAHAIFENEEYEIEYGLEDKLIHRPRFDAEKGKPILYYAVARMVNGGRVFHVMGRDDVERIRLRSQSGRNARSPWATDYDAMATKSAVRQMFKFLPKSTLLAQAIASDESIRVDLSPDALDAFDGQPGGTGGVEPETGAAEPTAEEQEAQAAADAAEASQAPEEPSSSQSVRAKVEDEGTARPKIRQTAVWKALRDAAIDKHGDRLPTVLMAIQGGAVMPLEFATPDELRAAVAFEEPAPGPDQPEPAPAVPAQPQDRVLSDEEQEAALDAAYEAEHMEPEIDLGDDPDGDNS
jgi:recombination protein RecT